MRDAHGLVPPGAERRFVDVGAGRLGVLRAAGPADRTPLLLVHGGGTDAAAISWYRLVEPLAAHGAVWAPTCRASELPSASSPSVARTPWPRCWSRSWTPWVWNAPW